MSELIFSRNHHHCQGENLKAHKLKLNLHGTDAVEISDWNDTPLNSRYDKPARNLTIKWTVPDNNEHCYRSHSILGGLKGDSSPLWTIVYHL